MLRFNSKFMLVIFISLTLLIAGCATQGQHKGRDTGIASGAIVGFFTGLIASGGNWKYATAGAVAGAIAGGLIGAYIDHKQTMKADDVTKEYGTESKEYGTESKVAIEDVTISKEVLKPKEKAKMSIDYVVVAPDGPQEVTEIITYYQGDKELAKKQQKFRLQTGGYETVYPLVVPGNAQEGEYKVVAEVTNGQISDKKEKTFTVTVANKEGSCLVKVVESRVEFN